MQAAAIASHRFGYSETSLSAVQSDPRGWVLEQFKRPAAMETGGLVDSVAALQLTREVLRTALAAKPVESGGKADDDLGPMTPSRLTLRQTNVKGLHRRWQHAIATPTPVAERWVNFWANHFCVASTKGTMIALVWPHEYEAIRPHAFGSFKELLRAAVVHPAMLLYLDNAQSIGPQSRAGKLREKGLNENLARELLELHTLGVNSGYTQQDVTQTAHLLTGWTVNPQTGGKAGFVPALHQPGPKTILGKRYAEGPQALDQLLDDLSSHPACAIFVATKLARHFVTDDPPAALVESVARRFRDSSGDLMALASALFGHDLAWSPSNPPKFKRPDELVLSAHRMLKIPLGSVERAVFELKSMGQAVAQAPSPQGWPDRAEDWLSADALRKRVQWADRFGDLNRHAADARGLARLAWGEDLSQSSRTQIDNADSSAQALALALASPEFQRR
ncbi:MAG: DUF1800 domain-containing protein [Betaproteobacteria bacterium]|nr:DUF1800 domain-containing protein [Betaproteobacteria bacterium]